MQRVLERERFDVLHLHEPMTPAICVAALALARRARSSRPATPRATSAGCSSRHAVLGLPDGPDRPAHRRLRAARESAARWLPGDYEVDPERRARSRRDADPAGREHTIVFIGRHEPRKGLQVLLRAWPEIHRRTGARLRLVGADPLAVRLLLTRLRVSGRRHRRRSASSRRRRSPTSCSRAKALVAPSLGGESFGMVLTRAFACATPVVASDIPGYREVMTPETRRARAAGRRRRARRGGRRRCSPTSRARRDGRGGAAARARSATPGTTSPERLEAIYERDAGARRSGRAREALAGSRAAAGAPLVLLVLAVAVVAALVARAGLEHRLPRVHRRSRWRWVVAAIGAQPALGRRARARLATVITQALPEPQPRFRLVFSAFCVGLLANAVLPGRARRARARRRAAPAPAGGRQGAWPTLVGTVFAHRLFDLVPGRAARRWVLLTAKIPHWAVTSLVVVLVVGFALLRSRSSCARSRQPRRARRARARSAALDHDGPAGPRRHAHARSAAAPRSSSSSLGWLCQLFAVWAAMRAFDIHVPLPAAGLVLLLMNVATIFPLWPGNVGLLQAAVATAARPVRRRLRARLRVRDRPAGDRGLGRRRGRADLPRARGPLVRVPEGDALRRAAGYWSRRRDASVCSIAHAIDAFDSTSGRNSHDVRP